MSLYRVSLLSLAAVLLSAAVACAMAQAAKRDGSGLGAMRAYSECAPDVVLMDFMMPHYNGVTAARQILSRDPGARVVLISGMSDTSELQWAGCV